MFLPPPKAFFAKERFQLFFVGPPPAPKMIGKYSGKNFGTISGHPPAKKLLENVQEMFFFGTPPPKVALELTPDLEPEGTPSPPEVALELTPDLKPEGTPLPTQPQDSRISGGKIWNYRYPPCEQTD